MNSSKHFCLWAILVIVGSSSSFAATRSIRFFGIAKSLTTQSNPLDMPVQSTGDVHLICDILVSNVSLKEQDVSTVAVEFVRLKNIMSSTMQTVHGMDTANNATGIPPITSIARASHVRISFPSNNPVVAFPVRLGAWLTTGSSLRVTAFTKYSMKSPANDSSVHYENDYQKLACFGTITVSDTDPAQPGSVIASGTLEYLGNFSGSRPKMYGVACPGLRASATTTSHLPAASAASPLNTQNVVATDADQTVDFTPTANQFDRTITEASFDPTTCGMAKWSSPWTLGAAGACGDQSAWRTDGACGKPSGPDTTHTVNFGFATFRDHFWEATYYTKNSDPATGTNGRLAQACRYDAAGGVYPEVSGQQFDNPDIGGGNIFKDFAPENSFFGPSAAGPNALTAGKSGADGPDYNKVGFPQMIANLPIVINSGKPF